MNTELLINITITAILLTVAGLLAYITVAILRSDLPATDDGPVVDVDPLGDATTVLPAIQAAADAQVGPIDHTGADDQWAAELHRAVTELPQELPRVRRRLADNWRDLVADDIPTLAAQPTTYGRHSEESIEMRLPVAPDWMPPIGRARIHAAIDGTQQMDQVQA